MQHLSTVTDYIHIVQTEYLIIKEFFHDERLADADGVRFRFCPICRSIMRFHTEHRVSLNQVGSRKVFCKAVRRIDG